MKYPSLTRVLAIDLHPRRFGYVVVESSDKLLDWGARSYRRKGGSTDALMRRLRSLLELWRPTVLVVQSSLKMKPGGNSRAGLLRLIAMEAKHHRVPLRLGPKLAGSSTKYENARLTAEQFSVLRWKMPPKRKPWESEHYSMSVFAAAALARMYLLSAQESSNTEGVPKANA